MKKIYPLLLAGPILRFHIVEEQVNEIKESASIAYLHTVGSVATESRFDPALLLNPYAIIKILIALCKQK